MTALRMAAEKQPGVPVVFFTGNKDPNKKVEVMSSGAVDYVCKDDAPALLRVLQRLCTKSSSGHEVSEGDKQV